MGSPDRGATFVPPDDRDTRLMAAASMYYVQHEKMDTIARRLHTSRSTVSRMLKEARERGLVEITLRERPTRPTGSALAIRQHYDVEVLVTSVTAGSTEAERLIQVAKTTAHVISNWFDSEMVMGVAWGTTTSAIAEHLGRKPTIGSTIVQLNGAANTRTSGSGYVGNLLGGFGDAFDAGVQYFPVPAFFDNAATRTAMWAERSVARVIEIQRSADIALFSVGAISGSLPSHVYTAGYLEPADLRTLKREGVVGDVCTVFLRADGSYDDLDLNQRATGPTPGELESIPRRLCAVAGSGKAAPLLAALKAGAITHLVIDDVTARDLLKLELDR